MIKVLVEAGSLIAIVVLGYLLKRNNFFKPSDIKIISKIILNITLPCVVITNFNQLDVDKSLLVIVAIGILCNLVMMLLGYVTSYREGVDRKAFSLVNYSGYNIGSFCMPFVQSFLPPVGVMATCLFDAGNAVMCTGVTYSIASAMTNSDKNTLKKFFKKIFSSIAFDTYILMLILSLMRIKLPQEIIVFTGKVGMANAFLAMLMIGIGLEIKIEKSYIKAILKFILIRYSVAVLLALLFFFYLPFALEIRSALVLIAFAPVSSIGLTTTERCNGDIELASTINSISILCSVASLTLLLSFMYT